MSDCISWDKITPEATHLSGRVLDIIAFYEADKPSSKALLQELKLCYKDAYETARIIDSIRLEDLPTVAKDRLTEIRKRLYYCL